MNQLKGTKRVYWLAGVALLITGVLVAAIVLPGTSKPDPGPNVGVPSMRNVPGPNEKMVLEVEKQP